MPYSADFHYDLFISYAHFDNAPGADRVQWVAELHNHLRNALRQRIGQGADDLKIFFDPMLRANQRLPELLDAASKSAIFLAVGSRAWVTRDFTLRELDAFWTANPDASRLFLIECLPLHAGQHYPVPLKEHLRIEFHAPSAEGTPMPLPPIGDARFRDRVGRLAEQIGDRLIDLRDGEQQAGDPGGKSGATIQPANSRNVVLIAQPTDDLHRESLQVDHFLRDNHIRARLAGCFPQGGKDFTNAFEQSLVDCALFVQLLGPYGGRQPADLPIGYTQYQAQAAEAAGIPIMQWRRPDLDPATVEDSAYAALLDGENVTSSMLGPFMEAVSARALAITVPAVKREKPSSLVFIDADGDDLAHARKIQQEFAAHQFAVALPGKAKNAEEARTEREEFFHDSDVIIFLYGSSEPTWIRGQLRLYTRVRRKREEAPRMLAIYTGPPADKEDIDFTIPDVRELNGRPDWDLEPIRVLIHELEP